MKEQPVRVNKNIRRLSMGLALVALTFLGLGFAGQLRQVSAAPSGTNFNHIVIIAMENQPEEILGTSNTPFLNSLMAAGSTLALDDHYSDSVSCSAGCYVEFTTGAANGDGLGDGWSCCVALTSVVDQMSSAGLTWQAYCAEGCPRGLDHFPFLGYTSDYQSPNLFTGSSVTTATFIAAANSANPPNYLWYTPTDSENMHDDSISSGDSYLQSFLVGSGTVSSPASGSLLASNLFTNPSDRTLLFIWFDECGESDGAGYNCDSNSNTANVEYGPGVVKAGYTSQSSYNEFSELAMIENNWELSLLGSAASNTAVNDIFSSAQPLPLSASYTYTPSAPIAGTQVVFTGQANGGTAPYTYTWSFGDGKTATGANATHTYASAETYTITMNVTDNNGQTTTKTQHVTVGPASPSNNGSNLFSTVSLLALGLILGGAAGATLYLVRYRARNRQLLNTIENRGATSASGRYNSTNSRSGKTPKDTPRQRVRAKSARPTD